jgi:CBS domain-containing protein
MQRRHKQDHLGGNGWAKLVLLGVWLLWTFIKCASSAIVSKNMLCRCNKQKSRTVYEGGGEWKMTIRTILDGRKGEIYSCSADVTVAQAIEILAEKRIGAMPVLDGKRVAGIFSERDVLHCIRKYGHEAMDQKVGDVMTADVISVDSKKSAIGSLSLMTKRRIRHLPVVDDDRLVGFVSIGDLVKYRIDRIESEAAAMRDYINSA